MSSYEKETERLLALWAETESDCEVGGPPEDKDDVLEINDQDSNSEQSEGEELPGLNESQQDLNTRLCFVGKDKKSLWSKFPVVASQTKTRSRNIVTQSSGVIGKARETKTILDAWQLYFPDFVIGEIVGHTNKYIQKLRTNYSRDRDAADTNMEEIKALIGLLYLAGVLRSSHLNLRDLWAQDGTGVEIFRLTMGINRFQFLLRALRFDDLDDREERKKHDKLAPIRKFFDGFVERCKANYAVCEFVTIDEMLEPFRGRCGFRQYMPNKPAKYGLKIFALVDSRSFYTYNLEVYVGTQPDGPYKVDNSASAIVQRLVQPISGTGRNVTVDNWFTSIPLALDLLRKHKLTITGTIRKNKREIPEIFTAKIRERKVKSSIFGFTEDMTLVSYKPKQNKIVTLLSTMHYTDEIDPESGDACKPSMITFYNATKGGVDVVDELKGTYSVSRTSCRWPLTLFFSALNISGINSHIITDANNNTHMSRRNFLKSLAMSLITPQLERRGDIVTLGIPIRNRIQEILGTSEDPAGASQYSVPGRCHFCSSRKNRKTKTQCVQCQKYICREHTSPLCPECKEGRH